MEHIVTGHGQPLYMISDHLKSVGMDVVFKVIRWMLNLKL